MLTSASFQDGTISYSHNIIHKAKIEFPLRFLDKLLHYEQLLKAYKTYSQGSVPDSLLKRSLIVLCYFKNRALIVKKWNCFLDVSCYRALGSDSGAKHGHLRPVLVPYDVGGICIIPDLQETRDHTETVVWGETNVLRHLKRHLAPEFIWNFLFLLCLLHTYFPLALEFLFAPEILCWGKVKSYIWSGAIVRPLICSSWKNSRDRSRSCQVLSI